jgi:hypothetical protein
MAHSHKTVALRAGILGMCVVAVGVVLAVSGCTAPFGYSNQSLYPDGIESVCVEMFDNRSFRRGVEYQLSSALAKRIQTDTPYRIVSDDNLADSVINGQIESISESILTMEREIGVPLEKEVVLTAVVTWKDFKTGRLMINSERVVAAASYSTFQDQDFSYASAAAANKLAEKIVELMEENW